MPGTLYVVATPIGNLEDITLRALRVLREVRLIAAEDTRRSAKLLSHYAIDTPTTSLHEHNESQKTARLVQRLTAGESVAVISDAGTPLVSDPGAHLVRAARDAGIPVVAVPGPSALLTALSAAGMETSEFVFLGFPPRRSNALELWVRANFTPPHRTSVFFEAPHRIVQTLESLRNLLVDRPIVVGRELTKIHEELVERPISQHLAALTLPRGEFTVIVPAMESSEPQPTVPAAGELARLVGHLVENDGLTPRQAAREIARRYRLSANEVYAVAQRGER